MAKTPALQFYPGDWRKDPGVQALGYFERGVWFELLMIMNESEQRGKLVLNGRAMTLQELSQLLHLSTDVIEQTLNKLSTTGVAKVEQNTQIVFNKRMTNDEQKRQAQLAHLQRIREARRAAGKKSAEQRRNKKQQNALSSSSSSSSTSVKGKVQVGRSKSKSRAQSEPTYLPTDFSSERAAIGALVAELGSRYPDIDVEASLTKLFDQCRKKGEPPPNRNSVIGWLNNERVDPMLKVFRSSI